jgi:plasmid stabilization system protein ParE
VILIVTSATDGDILDAAIWYEQREVALRESFLNAVYATLDVIEERPLQYQKIRGGVRRVMVAGFPYALYYIVSDKFISVIACLHASRDPKRLRDRIK